MLGQCWGHIWTILDYVWPNFTSRPTRALKFSRLGKYGLSKICIESLLFGTKSGPCWDIVWPSFTSRQTRYLKFSRLGKYGLKNIYRESTF